VHESLSATVVDYGPALGLAVSLDFDVARPQPQTDWPARSRAAARAVRRRSHPPDAT
jgi:hypothetical protein